MYPLISRSLRLVSFIVITAVSMLVWDKVFVFADSPLISGAQQNDPEANLKYLFAVFFLVWALFFGYIFFLSRRLKEMRNEVTMLKKIISEKDVGIYDAINKGINVASGEILSLLHGNDIFAVFEAASEAAARARAGELAADVCDAIDDLHGTAEYKHHLVSVFIGRALTEAIERGER